MLAKDFLIQEERGKTKQKKKWLKWSRKLKNVYNWK